MADMKTLSDGTNIFNVMDPNAIHLTDGKFSLNGTVEIRSSGIGLDHISGFFITR